MRPCLRFALHRLHLARGRFLLCCVGLVLSACVPSQPRSAPRAVASSSSPVEPQETRSARGYRFTQRVVRLGLEHPWEVSYGPDEQLWITERVGKRVVRVDPRSGDTRVALTVEEALATSGQDGLLGMALAPTTGASAAPLHVYLAYTYDADPGRSAALRAKIVRYDFDGATETLVAPRELLSGLPASEDHNAGRLLYGPDDKLYYSIGDQGKNHFNHRCEPNRAQVLPSAAELERRDWSSYQGKILRLELDGSVPGDNPTIAGVRSHVYSYGHRNAQGIAFAFGRLFAAEHGPKTDDELNLIEPGKNYGWPHVAGFQDDRAYVYGNWSASSPVPCAELPYTSYDPPPSVPRQRESEWSHLDFRPPLLTFYTVSDGFPFRRAGCEKNETDCWPTIAPSSVEAYVRGAHDVLGLGPSLLISSLKHGSLFRVPLLASGALARLEPDALFQTDNRYRDLALSADGRAIYVITDSESRTSGPTATSQRKLAHSGAVLEFRLMAGEQAR